MADGDALDEALEAEIARLAEGASFTIAEFGVDGAVVWEVSRDQNGTPRASRHLPSGSDPGRHYQRPGSPLLIVHSAPAEQQSAMLRRARPDAHVCSGPGPVAEHLREAIRDSALTRPYDLVVLRPSRSGRLGMDGRLLFPRGARRGYSQHLRIRCEPGGARGTVFAVVTSESRRFGIVSLQSGDIPPGPRELTAVLARPGRVVFEGLPGTLHTEQRPWSEIVSAIPAKLDRGPSAHLVCLIEVSCGSKELGHRIDRVEQLIEGVGADSGQLAVSLVSYGPHAFDRRQHEEPAEVLAWATTAGRALKALTMLRERTPPGEEYPRAAQLECALAEVAARLDGRDGHPVLVTVGSRPPHPPRVDIRTEIIPCPQRRNWRSYLGKLAELSGITFGALYDRGAEGTVWSTLGRDACEPLNVVEMPRFAADIRLSGRLQYVPFPLTDQEGT